MQSLILAAGRGTRLGALTDNCPKPMLPIQGIPMVERIMTGIAAETPIRSFVLVTGYRADVVQDYFGDGARWGWQVRYVHQETPQGVGHAVHCACEALSGDAFLMTYGDIMLDASNYGRFYDEWNRFHVSFHVSDPGKDAAGAALVGLNWVEDPWAGAAVYLDAAHRIERIEEKPPRGTATTHWNNAGLFIFDPLIFDYTARLTPSARGEYELPDAITAMIQAGHLIKGLTLTGHWRDVGTPQDYAAINEEYGAAQQ